MKKYSIVFFGFILSHFFSYSAFGFQEITRHIEYPITSFNPTYVKHHSDYQVFSDLFEGLVSINETGSIIPGMAEDWEISEDFKTYKFTLRPDAKWSNGDELTAQDFVLSFRLSIDQRFNRTRPDYLSKIKNAKEIRQKIKPHDALGVEALSKHSLVIYLDEPDPNFLHKLYHYTAFPVHTKSMEKYGGEWSKAGHLVTNGAYKLEVNVNGNDIILSKNQYYHDFNNVYFDRITYHIEKDLLNALRKYRSGELINLAKIPDQQLDFILKAFLNDVFIDPSLSTIYSVFNFEDKRLANRDVRLAMSMVIDKDEINQLAFHGQYILADSFIPKGINSYAISKTQFMNTSSRDRKKMARLLMNNLGYTIDHPLNLRLSYHSHTETNKVIAILLKQQWEGALPIKVTLVPTAIQKHYQNLTKGDFEIAIGGWMGDYVGAEAFLTFFSQKSSGTLNYANFYDKKFEELFENSLQNVKLRRSYIEKLEHIILDNVVVIPLLQPTLVQLVSPRIEGWQKNLQNLHLSKYLRFRTIAR